jgi:hypothetical protein
MKEKKLDETTINEFITETNFIQPRGCAYVEFVDRLLALKCLNRMKEGNYCLFGNSNNQIKVAWAINKGITKDRTLKSSWNVDLGCTFINWSDLRHHDGSNQSKISIVNNILKWIKGGFIDEESLPDYLVDTYYKLTAPPPPPLPPLPVVQVPTDMDIENEDEHQQQQQQQQQQQLPINLLQFNGHLGGPPPPPPQQFQQFNPLHHILSVPPPPPSSNDQISTNPLTYLAQQFRLNSSMPQQQQQQPPPPFIQNNEQKVSNFKFRQQQKIVYFLNFFV